MTNLEKYKTARERDDAFKQFCKKYHTCLKCPLMACGIGGTCGFFWLDLEAEKQAGEKAPLLVKTPSVVSDNGFDFRVPMADIVGFLHDKGLAIEAGLVEKAHGIEIKAKDLEIADLKSLVKSLSDQVGELRKRCDSLLSTASTIAELPEIRRALAENISEPCHNIFDSDQAVGIFMSM